MELGGYPIRAVSKLTGLPVDTLRAWERRYQAVRPRRGPRGRAYREEEVRRFGLLRDVVAHGYAIGQVAGLSDRQLIALIERHRESGTAAERKETRGGAQPRTREVESVLHAAIRFDYARVNLELGRLATILTARDLIHSVALPLMRAVGEQWQAGRVSIGQEHLVSSALRNLLGGLVRLYSREKPQVRLVFTTPAGELHEFGILAAAMLAAGAGVGVVYLGPNLPANEIVKAARSVVPHALVLAVTGGASLASLPNEVRQIARKVPTTTELWFGGREANQAFVHVAGRRAIVLPDLTAFESQLRRLGTKS